MANSARPLQPWTKQAVNWLQENEKQIVGVSSQYVCRAGSLLETPYAYRGLLSVCRSSEYNPGGIRSGVCNAAHSASRAKRASVSVADSCKLEWSDLNCTGHRRRGRCLTLWWKCRFEFVGFAIINYSYVCIGSMGHDCLLSVLLLGASTFAAFRSIGVPSSEAHDDITASLKCAAGICNSHQRAHEHNSVNKIEPQCPFSMGRNQASVQRAWSCHTAHYHGRVPPTADMNVSILSFLLARSRQTPICN